MAFNFAMVEVCMAEKLSRQPDVLLYNLLQKEAIL